jgi:hypothetical protein
MDEIEDDEELQEEYEEINIKLMRIKRSVATDIRFNKIK